MTTGGDKEFVGFGPASEYLGVSRNTLSHYVNEGTGPRTTGERRIINGHALRVFLKRDLDEWKAPGGRPGRGARVDLKLKGEVKGYAAACRHLGMHVVTFKKHLKAGTGPKVTWEKQPEGKRLWPKFKVADLDRWKMQREQAEKAA